MFIKRLRIRNWRNFKDADFPIYDRLFLIGPNAAGKSNLLDVFRFVGEVAAEGLKQAVARRGGVSSIRCLAARQYSDVVIALDLKDGETEWRYELIFNQDNLSNPIVKMESVYKDNFDKPIFARPNEYDTQDSARLRQTGLEQYSYNQDYREIADFLRTVSYQHIIPQAVRDPSGFSSQNLSNDPYGRDFLIRVWKTQTTRRDSRLKKITNVLRTLIPQLESLKIENKELKPHLVASWKNWRAHGTGHREDQLSDGTLRLLGLLWSFFEGNGPLLIEEPELSLHPEVVKLLPQLFHSINMHRKTTRQYFISTHSFDLLSDTSIRPTQVIRLNPDEHQTSVLLPTKEETDLMNTGRVSAADVLFPLTKSKSMNQLIFEFFE
jgi:predicted ATPase